MKEYRKAQAEYLVAKEELELKNRQYDEIMKDKDLEGLSIKEEVNVEFEARDEVGMNEAENKKREKEERLLELFFEEAKESEEVKEARIPLDELKEGANNSVSIRRQVVEMAMEI